jgi:hypothetical protein
LKYFYDQENEFDLVAIQELSGNNGLNFLNLNGFQRLQTADNNHLFAKNRHLQSLDCDSVEYGTTAQTNVMIGCAFKVLNAPEVRLEPILGIN